MTTSKTQDVISVDGTRYTRKAAGSPFASRTGKTLSCYLCGKHCDPATGAWRTLVGKPRFVCDLHPRREGAVKTGS